MERIDFFRERVGRTLYITLMNAVREGATLQDLRVLTKEAVDKAHKAMLEAGVEN